MAINVLYERCREFLSAEELRRDEPLAKHTTFRVGGPADLLARPCGDHAVEKCLRIIELAKAATVPVFILGGGSNVVVADRGVRGLVLEMSGCCSLDFDAAAASCSPRATAGRGADCCVPAVELVAECGAEIDTLVRDCAVRGLAGLESFAGMPGTVGGALWMNARCYGSSISDILVSTRVLNENSELHDIPFCGADFAYKKSPFQTRQWLLLSARFRLTPGNPAEIAAIGERHRVDRAAKGHYRLPSAGSAFKNDYNYGKPTGQIVDELGLRGLTVGGAAVAPWHGNIIVNQGGATATDIRALVDEVGRRVHEAVGLHLEPEILFVGDW